MDYLFFMTEEDADKEQELIYRYRAFYCKTKSDIGQIPQDGKLGQNVVLLLKSLRVAKADIFLLFFFLQLFLFKCVPWTLETLSSDLGTHL